MREENFANWLGTLDETVCEETGLAAASSAAPGEGEALPA
jgi:hypothetical protein